MPTVCKKHTASGEVRDRILVDVGAVAPAGFTYEPDTAANRLALNAFRSAADAAASTELREAARHFLVNDPRPEMKAMRGLFFVLLDEINLLRAKIANNSAPATPMPARTTQQGLTAVLGKITDGSAD